MLLALLPYATTVALVLVGLDTASAANPKLVLKDRNYYAYGYEGGVTEGVPNGYAYGMGGLEKVTYDFKEKILYGVSEQGFITLIDYGNGPIDAPQLPIVITDKNTYTDISVCSKQGILFAATKADPNPGSVAIYKAATRSGGIVNGPELIHTVTVGYGPDHIKANKDCSILAVANEGEGYYDDDVGLINPPGSVSLIKGPFIDPNTPPNVSEVAFPWTDDELLAKGVHLPLSENALEYWDEHSGVADDLDFSGARASYATASVLEPEWLVWSADEKHVLVSLQENAALVKVNVESEEAEDIYSYGLKSWEDTPIDIIEDDGCATMPKVQGLFSVRTPDSITSIVIDGETYIATANEGDDVEYGNFSEKLKAKDIFDGADLGLKNAIADPAIFDPTSPMTGKSKYFNSKCGDMAGSPDWCASSMRFTVGSSMVDYSDPTAPLIKSLVGIGGRGISIYKLTDKALDLVWDSKDEFEREGCAAFPWSHNGVQDEEYADVNGTLYKANEKIRETLLEMNNLEEDGCEDRGDAQPGACALGDTVDGRSLKDGYAAEAIVAGEACGRKYVVTVSEKNSVGFLYDVSDITNPKLAQVFHLSPASEKKNPIVAYADKTLGEIDSESIIFFEEGDNSPTGNAAILFVGAYSSSTSFWEFDCGEEVNNVTPSDSAPASVSSSAFVVTGTFATGILASIIFIVL